MMAIVDDLKGTIALFTLLWHVPNEPECWIRYEVPEWESKEQVKEQREWTELELVKFKVCGMPLLWKFLNFLFIALPKSLIWWTLSTSGIHFLMETAGIVDLVVNCMALTFILQVDEMIFERLATVAAKYIMANLEDMPLFGPPPEETEDEE